ncbi:leucine-rich repeat-containing protein 15-like [Aphidius gifuensis]|uniref:leucine-rich repeat-containing protein 15-like n=1 Tax=Aphidius gifuensis TaxID=684658 RepID=UPI001CDBC30B|nr:leucine-rich repeat-containing protein 15-like [Aphidius gifuensis]
MKNLKNLQLITSRIVLLEDSILPIKDTLESLTLSLYESSVFLYEILLRMENLKTLTIENHDAFNFHQCVVDDNSNYITLESLRYDGGSFEKISSKSLECLKMLDNLAIHKSSLQEIHAGAFSGLENLRILNIQFNQNLTVIKKGVLDGLQKLDILALIRLCGRKLSVLSKSSIRTSNIRKEFLKYLDEQQKSREKFDEYEEIMNRMEGDGIDDEENHTTNLATLEEDAFFGLDNLLTINLSHNNLTHIPNNVFNKLNKLNELTLHHNSIKTIEMGALVLNHAMKFVNISNNQLERITAGTFKGMICDYLDLSGNIILSHERNILALTEIKKSNINGHVSTRGHASKSEDPPINDYHVSWTSWGLGCDEKYNCPWFVTMFV